MNRLGFLRVSHFVALGPRGASCQAARARCVMEIGSAITAITLVALGTSLPDTFASRQAAVQETRREAERHGAGNDRRVVGMNRFGIPSIRNHQLDGLWGSFPHSLLRCSKMSLFRCSPLFGLLLPLRVSSESVYEDEGREMGTCRPSPPP